MRFLYNILFTFFFLIASPHYFLRMWRRGNWREGFGQRFAQYDAKLKMALTNRHVLWIHAVSVGEVNIATHLIRALELRAPNLKIVVSTTTSTGMGELRRKLPSHIAKIYYPIDRRKFASRALRVINPDAIVLVEAEIWPNFLWLARDRRIPVVLVNARLSPRSYRGYRLFGVLFRKVFHSFAAVGVQNDADAAKLIALGCRPEAVHVVGNLKFDAARIEERPAMNSRVLLRQLGVADDAPVIVAGSTHAGEEVLLARVAERLRRRFPNLFLVLVPRHFERGNEVGKQLDSMGVKFVFRTEISASTLIEAGKTQCLLVNTTGELVYFYEVASAIFVGKSLTAEGGQNPIEPGVLGKPMVFGPHMENFQAITEALLEGKGAIQVNDEAGLEKAFESLLSDEQAANELGRNAQQVIKKNQGSIERTVNLVLNQLNAEEIYIRNPTS
ncbi:MAG: 3-deoxy-D-manno-octulosonic acid transferase [Verrucomicrobiota bacterium]|nr:3-deoxy-D-manno-octulosonic acid transferase [Verrucomicrobiota bacterium]